MRIDTTLSNTDRTKGRISNTFLVLSRRYFHYIKNLKIVEAGGWDDLLVSLIAVINVYLINLHFA